ncbi:MAG: cobaltochelatase subunit CobN [Lawsonella sp.]|uniref:cobaltochelatase subunit CobN n=1 Tax=Lawsonella sp. TaxID=2041415 RepID=UPI002A75F5D6|nr:cobaltochelatase subunit CobN [Lawsonella sp.]MDY2979321.1 cobaltochelatase subunit CobN [Lawsonella sp.]
MRAVLLSTSDTDGLAAAQSHRPWLWRNPSGVAAEEVTTLLTDADVIVLRLLGSARTWDGLISLVTVLEKPLVVVSGEQLIDTELLACSTVSAEIAHVTHLYLAASGADNMESLWDYLELAVCTPGMSPREASNHVPAPHAHPAWGIMGTDPGKNELAGAKGRVGIVFYRSHYLAGNTAFITTLAEAFSTCGGVAVPIFVSSLRTPDEDLLNYLGTFDALVVTVLAAHQPGQCTFPDSAVTTPWDKDDTWDGGALARLGIPIFQGLCLTSPHDKWLESDEGMSPLDAASQVAIPECDGRIITVPFSFKEEGEDGLSRYVADPERCSRLASLVMRTVRLGYLANADKRIVLMLSAYPTKHARIGNAVGLDTPASVLALLHALAAAGYTVDEAAIPGYSIDDPAADNPAELMKAIIAAGGQDADWLTDEQVAANTLRLDAATYEHWLRLCPLQLQQKVEDAWGPAPGELFVDARRSGHPEIFFAGLELGNVLVMVQPPRGFGENPVSIYHDPELAPSHHYLAAYWWLAADRTVGGWGAHAIVHVGKHGNLEWLPGKQNALSPSCGPDAALRDLPVIYPFLINDPGEGTQAKRRAHAVLVDHLIPPTQRAESYGDIARLEQLLDEHANISAMDLAKLPAIRQQIWTLMTAAQMHRDLGLEERPNEDEFDDMLMHVDGWLCEIKDVQIRDGLHVLSREPQGEHLTNMVLAIAQARQLWGGQEILPGLREVLGLKEDGTDSRHQVDRAEEHARFLVEDLAAHQWDVGLVTDAINRYCEAFHVGSEAFNSARLPQVLKFLCEVVVPRLRQTRQEIPHVLAALDGAAVPPGPAGSPLRGLVSVLPTGRNFYALDPRAIPSELAWETGQDLARTLLDRYCDDHGRYPESIGISLWATSAPLSELGRPRIDVTLRISGFFRDAFPAAIALMDDAVQLVADLPEDTADNYIRAHALLDEPGGSSGKNWRTATTRIFGSRPGTYGAGVIQLMESGQWETTKDIAEVYTTWGGYAYGRNMAGIEARTAMQRNFARITLATKNIDSREHDIFDSDDYFQFHGGMVATVEALRNHKPASYIGDSTRPSAVRHRSLSEEATRVVRARVLNPRWLAGMRKHGYKGAFEMAATVDYLFGYDATTGVLDDWMYGAVAESYLLDTENRTFLEEANPWALHGMCERLMEAVQRGLWENPDSRMLEQLTDLLLETEGSME